MSESQPRRSGRRKDKFKQVDEEQTDKPEENDGDDSGGDSGVIRCVCGQTEEIENDGKTFIQCETCQVWQHAQCVGIRGKKAIPEEYFCEMCRPDLHVQLLEKLQKAKNPTIPSPASSLKRKRDEPKPAETVDTDMLDAKKEEEVHIKVDAQDKDFQEPPPKSPSVVSEMEDSDYGSDGEEVIRTKARRVSSRRTGSVTVPVEELETLTRRTSSSAAKPTLRKKMKSFKQLSYEEQDAPYTDLEDIMDPIRKSVAKALQKDLLRALTTATTGEEYTLPEGSTVANMSQTLGFAIEFAMYQELQEPGNKTLTKYKDKYRTIAFNIKDSKNPHLRKRVFNGEIKPEDLVKMTSEDMANPEMKMLAEALREEGLKQSVLVQESGPRMRKTHKGEELIVSDMATLPDTSQISFPVSAPIKEESTDAPSETVKSPPTEETSHYRKPSGSFDIKNVWNQIESPKEPIRRQPSINTLERATSIHDNLETLDADLTAMIEDGTDSPPYSPTDFDPPTTDLVDQPIWSGKIVMPSVTEMITNARFVGGPEDADLMWKEILGDVVSIGGRIGIQDASKYLCHQRFSTSKIVVAISFSVSGDDAKSFDTLYNYFLQKERYGVMTIGSIRVRDAYIVPLAPTEALPEYIELLDSHIIPTKREERMLLGIIVLNKGSAQIKAISAAASNSYKKNPNAPGHITIPPLNPVSPGSQMSPTPAMSPGLYTN